MSSWKTANRSRIRLGYYQPTPAGTFVKKEQPATVVSAYYEMLSKYPNENYKTWIRLFLESVDCWLIFFCEKEMVPFIEDCRKAYRNKTTIVPLPRDEWIANRRFPQTFWDDQFELDSEYKVYTPESLKVKLHCPELYKVWFEKKEFVKRAIALNPYKHVDFVWADAGICRSKGLASLIRQFPVANRIPTDKLLMLNVGEFTERDSVVQVIKGVSIKGGPQEKMRIGGGVLAGSIGSWAKYFAAFDSTFIKYIRAKQFCGKEQIIMASFVLEHTEHVSLVEPKAIGPELWFYLALWLGCSDKLYSALNDKVRQVQKKTYEELKDMA